MMSLKGLYVCGTCTTESVTKLAAALGTTRDVTISRTEDGRCLVILVISVTLVYTQVFFCRHLYPPPSPIYAGGANGSYVRGVSFCHDGRHIASVADDGYVFMFLILSKQEQNKCYCLRKLKLYQIQKEHRRKKDLCLIDQSLSYFCNPLNNVID